MSSTPEDNNERETLPSGRRRLVDELSDPPKSPPIPKHRGKTKANRLGAKSLLAEDVIGKEIIELADDIMTAKVGYRYTDAMLVDLMNESLAKYGYRIPMRTWMKWKQYYIDNDEGFIERNPLILELFAIYGRMLREAQEYLFEKMEEGGNQWSRFAWILERKFEAWNKIEKRMSKDEVTTNVDPNAGKVQLILQMPNDVKLIMSEQQMLEEYENSEDYIDHEEVD